MKRFSLYAALTCGLSLATPLIAAPAPTMPKVELIGILDFQQCVDTSKKGKEETTSLKSLEGQLTSTIQESEKELQAIIEKAQDADYRDSLSPEAEREMMQKGQMLASQIQEQKQQFYQIMQQAEGRLMQELKIQVMRAASVVAKKHNLDLVLPESLTLYYKQGMDVTKEVVAELDRLYGEEKAGDK